MILLSFALLAGACKKRAGEGGTSSIKGKVWVEDWNAAFTVKNGEYAGADENVYIIYGDDVSYGDKTKANYNGEFEFKYLRKGKYRIYVYSKDKTLVSQSGETYVTRDVEIKNKKETITVDDLLIYK